MTTPDQDFDDTNDTNDGDERQPNWRRKLEADAQAGREAQAQAQAALAEAQKLQRELAMVRAGVDLDTPLGQMFSRAYDGQNDVDEVRNAYSQITGTGQPQVDQAAMARIGQTLQGGVPSGGAPVDFEQQLDSIPMVVDGQMNPDYVNQVLSATADQATREGRVMNVSGAGAKKWTNGGPTSPATKPLRG